jgi:hypothetical protein
MREREAGQILPLVALLMVAAGAGALLLGRLGGAAVQRARAQTAADAAALAGALDGREAAASVALDNGARLVRFEARGAQAFVRVEVGAAGATARARRGSSTRSPSSSGAAGMLPRWVGATAPARPGLAPALQLALARATALLGRPVPVTSGYRSPAEQARLYAHRAENPYPVAPPGTSAHERGLAIDVPPAFVPELLQVAGQVGLCHPYPVADPVHFELCADRGP